MKYELVKQGESFLFVPVKLESASHNETEYGTLRNPPREIKRFWAITGDGHVVQQSSENPNAGDFKRFHNYFPTREDAERARDEVFDVLDSIGGRYEE